MKYPEIFRNPALCNVHQIHYYARQLLVYLTYIFTKNNPYYDQEKKTGRQIIENSFTGNESGNHGSIENNPENRNKAKHFEFLDGYRGFCALLVVNWHASFLIIHEGTIALWGYAENVGVHGFFVLSSFLLTYRFIKELDVKFDSHRDIPNKSRMDNIKHELKIFTLTTVKYTTRRFFRIYVPFCIAAADFQKMLLNNFKGNVLWTIPPELKYYFLIPLISIIFLKLKRVSLLLVIIGYTFIFLNEKLNILPMSIGYRHSYGGTLTSYFTIFFSGSLVAVIYYFYFEQLDTENYHRPNEKLPFSFVFRRLLFFKRIRLLHRRKLIDLIVSFIFLEIFHILFKHYSPAYWKKFKIHTDIIMMSFGLEPMRLCDHIKYGILFSFVLYLMLVFEHSKFTDLFAKSSLLKSTGKYSFGIYLLHMYLLTKRFKSCFYTNFELIMVANFYCFFAGFLFFYLIENPLMNISNDICRKIENSRIFK